MSVAFSNMNYFVMAGLVPAIHVFDLDNFQKTWMPATSAGMTANDSVTRI